MRYFRLATTASLLAVVGCATRELPAADSLAVARDSIRADSIRADSIRADSIARVRQDSINRATPGYVIDSLLPPDEEARRFRAAFPGDSATTFVGGEASRDALARRFVRALAAADTTDLRRLVVKGREFVDVYYPASPYSSGPYHQPVSFAWRMIQDPSAAGLTALLRRFGGHHIVFVSQTCEPKVLHEGRVDRYTGCLVRLVDERGDTVTRRLYGSVVSHRGHYKFLSFTNDI